jgi:DedD protein
VIVLPGLLDGKKKHYEDEFASIPLVPKAGDTEEKGSAGPVTQSLPAQPPEGAGEAVNAGAAEAAHAAAEAQGEDDEDTRAPQNTLPPKSASEHKTATPPKTLTPPTMTESRQQQAKAAQPKPAEPKKVEPKRDEPKRTETPKAETTPQTAEKAPVGQSYVVQLGALKNADKVNEIVAKLRLSGYRAYTVPSSPVQGQITRVFVGPEANRQNLEASLPQLKNVSGLSGVVRGYATH